MISFSFAGTMTAGRHPIFTSPSFSSHNLIKAFDAETPVAHPP
jgi:hypothetical protein